MLRKNKITLQHHKLKIKAILLVDNQKMTNLKSLNHIQNFHRKTTSSHNPPSNSFKILSSITADQLMAWSNQYLTNLKFNMMIAKVVLRASLKIIIKLLKNLNKKNKIRLLLIILQDLKVRASKIIAKTLKVLNNSNQLPDLKMLRCKMKKIFLQILSSKNLLKQRKKTSECKIFGEHHQLLIDYLTNNSKISRCLNLHLKKAKTILKKLIS